MRKHLGDVSVPIQVRPPHSTSPYPKAQVRHGDYTSKWIAYGLLTTWWVSC